ncbi:MAG: response regulator [Bacteroidota bacterium]
MNSKNIELQADKKYASTFVRNTLILIGLWMLAVLLYKIIRLVGVEYVIELRMHEGKVHLHILHIVVGGVLVGVLFGLLDLGLHRSGLSTKSYSQIIVVKFLAFFGALLLGIVSARIAGQVFFFNVPFGKVINDLPEFLSSPLLTPLYVYTIVASFAITFLRQVEKKFGTRVLINLLVGKYFKAKEVELAEAKEYLEFQVQQRTSALEEEVAHRKRTEKELLIAKEEAETANVAKTRFLANMSHEIRTPLNAIVGFSQILLNQSRQYDLSSDFIKYLHNIHVSGQNLSELINHILDLSKIEAGKMTVSEEDMNLKQLLQSVYHLNKAEANEKNITLLYDFDLSNPQFIRSDRSKIKQILMNLLANAIKFTPEGKHIYLKSSFKDDEIIFEVKDEGIGIGPEKQAIVFEPFEQADSSVTRGYGGTGLGLAITKTMVGLLGGYMKLKSAVGQGSTFTVFLPYQSPTKMDIQSSEINLDNISIPKDARILVVEDNPMNQEMIKAFFNEIHHDVIVASSGQEGVEMAAKYNPDLVFMDIHMPGMDGYEAMNRINEANSKTPIVALSADAFKEQQEQALQAGFADYITKPIQMEQLVTCLHKFLLIEKQTAATDGKEWSEDEKAKINSTLNALSETPIYETEKLAELVDSFGSLVLSKWKNLILDTIFSGDEIKFNRLLEELKKGVKTGNQKST